MPSSPSLPVHHGVENAGLERQLVLGWTSVKFWSSAYDWKLSGETVFSSAWPLDTSPWLLVCTQGLREDALRQRRQCSTCLTRSQKQRLKSSSLSSEAAGPHPSCCCCR